MGFFFLSRLLDAWNFFRNQFVVILQWVKNFAEHYAKIANICDNVKIWEKAFVIQQTLMHVNRKLKENKIFCIIFKMKAEHY